MSDEESVRLTPPQLQPTVGARIVIDPRETRPCAETAEVKSPTLAEFQEVLSQGHYAVKDLETLKWVLNDAFDLYDAMAGKGRLSELLAAVEKRADPEAFALIVLDLVRFLQPRLRKIVAEIMELQQDHLVTLAGAFALALERRPAAVLAMKQRIRDLWAGAGITDTASAQTVEGEICRQICRDAVALARVENGDLSEVDRLFHERVSASKGLIQ